MSGDATLRPDETDGFALLTKKLPPIPRDPGAVQASREAADARHDPFKRRAVGLEVLNGSKQGLLFALNQQTCYFLGRADGLDIVVPDHSISRRHCQLTWQGDTLWVEDLASSNGTSLNGCEIVHAQVRKDDVLEVGETVFRFVELPEDLEAEGGYSKGDTSDRTSILNLDALPADTTPSNVFAGVRLALRELERSLERAFRDLNEAERIAREWEKTARDATLRAEDLERERDRLDHERGSARGRVEELELLVGGDNHKVNARLEELHGQVQEWRDRASSEERARRHDIEKRRELEAEVAELRRAEEALRRELENQRTALALTQAALNDEREVRRKAMGG